MPDWLSTLLIQIANVAILVFLLRRFLYKPVRKVLAERRARVEKEMDDAATALEQAEETRKNYEEQLKNAEAEAESIEAKAREKALKEVEEAAERARDAAGEERAKALKAWKREEEEAVRALRMRELDVALSLSKRLLESATGPALAARLAVELASRVRDLEAEEIPPFPAEAEGDAVPVRLKSSHDPGPEAVEEVRRAFQERFGREVSLTRTTDGGLVCGVEAECGSLVIRSHLAQRLEEAREALEKSIAAGTDESGEDIP